MIPLSLFTMLLAIATVMMIYAIVDHEHRLYANIVIEFVSAVLFMYLGEAIASGAVYDVISGYSTPVISLSFKPALHLIGFIAFAYSAFMSYEAIDEQLQQKKENAISAGPEREGDE